MCMTLVDHVVQHQRYGELNIPECAWHSIESSWERGDQKIFGRLDLSYDGVQPPKLLEYNADTPKILAESSIVQRQWQEQVRPGYGQFNNIQESLVRAWSRFEPGLIHLTCDLIAEDFVDVAYMSDTMITAGLSPKIVSIGKILWDGQYFRDTENTIITRLFKLYPWEWLFEDVYREYAHQRTMKIIEPTWKMILNNKSFMVLLWELFPDHPNLLPSFFDRKKLGGEYVKKPFVSRQGQNISLYSAKGNTESGGVYGDGAYMYQQLHSLPNFDGNYPVIGSWLIEGKSAGIGIREDKSPITFNISPFVPHFID